MRITAKEGFAAQSSHDVVVAIDTAITPELAAEGLAREVVNRVQNIRKELDLPYQARLRLFLTADAELTAALERHKDYIMAETLTAEWQSPAAKAGEIRDSAIDGHPLQIQCVVKP